MESKIPAADVEVDEDKYPKVDPDRLYSMTYEVKYHEPALTKAEVEAIPGIGLSVGACTSGVFVSVNGVPLNGQELSVEVMSFTPPGGKPMDARQLFSLWVIMAAQLAEQLEPGSPHHFLTSKVIESHRLMHASCCTHEHACAHESDDGTKH
jgi:hypothetical protein